MAILKKIYNYCSKNFLFQEIEKKIVNEYLINKHHITINNLENWVKNCQKIQTVIINNIEFNFIDNLASNTIDIVTEELQNASVYDFSKLTFKEGDIVIDIGANIGMVSIFLAKKFPFLKIYSYEPVLQNFYNFLTNIKTNNIPDGIIFPFNMAVTSDGRNVDMSINTHNYGGCSISDIISSGATTQSCNTNIKSITLENIFLEHNIEKLKLLKIDCEGAEYEIIKNTNPDKLKIISMVRGEFHENKTLTQEYDAEELLKYTKQYIDDCKIMISKNCFIM